MKTRPVKFHLPPQLHKDLHIRARNEGLTGSALAEEILREGLRHREEREERKFEMTKEAVA